MADVNVPAMMSVEFGFQRRFASVSPVGGSASSRRSLTGSSASSDACWMTTGEKEESENSRVREVNGRWASEMFEDVDRES